MKKIIAVLAVLASFSSAQAASDKDWSVAGLAGFGVGQNSFSGFTWGAEVNYLINPSWSAGVYWSNTKKDIVSSMPVMFEVSYWCPEWKGFYAGPRLGIVSSKQDAVLSIPAVTSSDFTVGAQVGYDHFISTDWSLGINANWNLVMASNNTNSLFNFVVPVKFHF